MNPEGTIFDIKRFAIHDGPGIRTTVFLKGCLLSCVWCHNPEGISFEKAIWVKEGKCISCGKCRERCTNNAIIMKESYVVIDQENCTVCGSCLADCPTKAITHIDHNLSAKELVAELLKDRLFAETSGGGVTFSGGEPLAQAGFVLEALKLLKANQIHTCIETSLMVSQSVLKKIIPYVDLIIADLKIFDDEKHQKYAGASNRQILENIEFLGKTSKKLLVRIPLIPELTATKENLRDIVRFLKTAAPESDLELINYNSLAPNKYRFLNQEFFKNSLKAYTKQEIEEFEILVERWRNE